MVPQSLPKGGVCNLKIYITSLWASKSSDIHAIWTGWTLRDAKQMYNHKSPLTSKLWWGGDRQFSKKPTPLKNTKKYLNALIWLWYIISTPNYPLLSFISPYRQNVIQISFFLQKAFCGPRPMDIFGGKKSLDSFENWKGGSPTHAKPMYNNSWSPLLQFDFT